MTSLARYTRSLGDGLRRPVWRVATPLAGLALLLLPGWLFWDDLEAPRLQGDDFAFLADCRSGAEPLANLFTPHNTHIVPAFRLLTATLGKLAARSPGDLPMLAFLANYAALVAVLLLIGHVVAWESRRIGAGFAAMVLAGLSSVIRPAVIWYSAGQTLWAAAGCLGVIAACQFHRVRPAIIWFALAGLGVVAAFAFWGGGAVAGYAGAAYLLADRNRADRRPAWALAIGSTLLLGILALTTLRGPAGDGAASATAATPAPPQAPAPREPLRALTHTAQAIPEKLIAPNLGVDIATTPTQGVLFTVGLVACWLATTRGRAGSTRPRPLEAAGATLVLVPYLLAFALRSDYAFENLRKLGWYDTLPQFGLTLFLAGWFVRPAEPGPGIPRRPSWGGLLGVFAFALVMLGLQVPRVEKQVIATAPAMTPWEKEHYLIPELQWLRARYFLSDLAERQRTTLIRLSLASDEARRTGISREAIRLVAGRPTVPGWPPALAEIDGLDLFAFPPDSTPESHPALSRRLRENLLPVAQARPGWLPPEDPWPAR